MEEIQEFEELLKDIKYFLWLSGIPFGDFKIRLRFYILMFLLILITVEEFCYFRSKISAQHLVELTDLAPCMAIKLLSILRMFAFAFKRHKMFDLTMSLKRLYQVIINDPGKLQVVNREIVLLKSFVKFYFKLNLFVVSCYHFQPMVMMLFNNLVKNKLIFRTPFAILLPFPIDAWLPWFFVYLHSVISGYTCVLFYIAIDGAYYVLVTFVCANFKLISHKIECLEADSVNDLEEIVKDHQYILTLAEDLEDVFTETNFINVLIISLEICALGITITMGSWEQIPRCVLFLGTILLQILMMSIFGENVIEESTKISKAAYSCKWYDMNTRSKKNILTIMLRSNKPSILTAFKFSVISYASFTKIMSTSWSYFTILRTVEI